MNNPSAEAMTASHLMTFALLRLLVDQGIITKQAALSIPVSAAESIRSATEKSDREQPGEEAARSCEMVAKWVADLALSERPKGSKL